MKKLLAKIISIFNKNLISQIDIKTAENIALSDELDSALYELFLYKANEENMLLQINCLESNFSDYQIHVFKQGFRPTF